MHSIMVPTSAIFCEDLRNNHVLAFPKYLQHLYTCKQESLGYLRGKNASLDDCKEDARRQFLNPSTFEMFHLSLLLMLELIQVC